MEPGKGVGQSKGVAGTDLSASESVSNEDSAKGKFTGSGKSREVTTHPPVTQLREYSGEATASKSLQDWEIAVAETKSYLSEKIAELDTPSKQEKRHVQAEIREIHSRLQKLMTSYNSRAQQLHKKGILTQDQNVEISSKIALAQPEIDHIERLITQLGKWSLKDKVTPIRKEVKACLVRANNHFLNAKASLEAANASPKEEVQPATPMQKASYTVFKGTPEELVQEAMSTFRVTDFREPYCWLRLDKNPRKTRDALGTFVTDELTRFNKLKPLLNLATGWHAVLAKQNTKLGPDPDAKKCLQALLFLEEKHPLLKECKLDTPEEKQEVLDVLKEADEHVIQLHKFDRRHPEALLRLLTKHLPDPPSASDHLQLLLARHALPTEKTKFTSDTRSLDELTLLSKAVTRRSESSTDQGLYQSYAEPADFFLNSPGAFASLVSSASTAEELHSLVDLCIDCPKPVRLGELQSVAEAYSVAKVDLSLSDIDQLDESLNELHELKTTADRQQQLVQRRRKEVCDTCRKAIGEHLIGQLRNRGAFDRAIKNERSRDEHIEELNNQLQGFASVQWNSDNQQPIVTLLHSSPHDIEEAFSQFLSSDSTVATTVAGDLERQGLAVQVGQQWQLQLNRESDGELKQRLNTNMEKFHAGLNALKKHQVEIENYIGIQKEQPEMARLLKHELDTLMKKVGKKGLPRRKAQGTRKKLFEMAGKIGELPASLSETSKALETHQQELLQMIKTGRLKVSEARPALQALHKQLACTNCWSPAGKSKFAFKESEALSLESVETALQQTTRPFPRLRRIYLRTFKPQKHKLLKEARLVIAAGQTATASPRLLLKEYTDLQEKLEKFGTKDQKLMTLAKSLGDYTQKTEEQWPVLPVPVSEGGAAAA